MWCPVPELEILSVSCNECCEYQLHQRDEPESLLLAQLLPSAPGCMVSVQNCFHHFLFSSPLVSSSRSEVFVKVGQVLHDSRQSHGWCLGYIQRNWLPINTLASCFYWKHVIMRNYIALWEPLQDVCKTKCVHVTVSNCWNNDRNQERFGAMFTFSAVFLLCVCIILINSYLPFLRAASSAPSGCRAVYKAKRTCLLLLLLFGFHSHSVTLTWNLLTAQHKKKMMSYHVCLSCGFTSAWWAHFTMFMRTQFLYSLFKLKPECRVCQSVLLRHFEPCAVGPSIGRRTQRLVHCCLQLKLEK